ncbi:MAG TPA: type II secretion system F family protein [Drouetiella sp.]|jgi:tight adherence protein C
MWYFSLSFLLFAVVLAAALLAAQPLFVRYVESYAVRVRPRKVDAELAGVQPRNSKMLLVFQGIGDSTLRMFPSLVDEGTQSLLLTANYRSQAHLATYTGIRVLVTGSSLVLCLCCGSGSGAAILLAAPATALSWLVPNYFLAARSRRRQSQILRELPVVIDLLIVCAQAGVGLLNAIDKISKETADTCPVICSEMEQLIQEVKVFARTAATAFRNMADRCGVDELSSLASALVAAEQKGADISFPLKQQAQAIRDRLKRKKEEEAAKVPVKMVPVIMLFVMPLILVPLLGPAITTIYIQMAPIMGIK